MLSIASRASRSLAAVAAAPLLAAIFSVTLSAQEPQPAPVVLFVRPLVVTPGEMVTLDIRGQHLQNTKQVQLRSGDFSQDLPVKKQEEAKPPDRVAPNLHGDYRVEAELKLPDDFAADQFELTIECDKGKTAPLSVRVLKTDQLLKEVEPNDGFRQSQAMELGKFVVASIHRQHDVDVFRIELKAGQKYKVDVEAAARGSVADLQLQLFSENGALLATSDDRSATSRDPELTFSPTSDGPILISLLDATDRGSDLHPYLLRVTPQ